MLELVLDSDSFYVMEGKSMFNWDFLSFEALRNSSARVTLTED